MHPVLFDTSIYIALLRKKEDAALQARRMAAGSPVWLSSVVLEELYAGGNGKSRKVLERLEYGF
jgi:predicted nucleic acid-binding protein